MTSSLKVLLAGLLMGACSEPVASQKCLGVQLESGCWTFLGLKGEWVRALADTPWGLYAGTRERGVFRFNPDTGEWEGLGLDRSIVSSILFVPGDTSRLLVGVQPRDSEETVAAVFASEDRGRTWKPWDGGLAAREKNRAWTYSLALDPHDPSRLFMGGQSPSILRSEDGGRSWEHVQGEGAWGGGVHALALSPRRKGWVWAGGQSAVSTAWVDRSSDGGSTWSAANPTPRSGNSIWALALDSSGNRIFAGAAAGVMQSDDDGETWRYVLDRVNGVVYAVVVLPSAIYAAAGEDFELSPERPLGLYRSTDGGQEWERLVVPDSAGGGYDLIVDREGRLLIGTRLSHGRQGEGGVWRFEP